MWCEEQQISSILSSFQSILHTSVQHERVVMVKVETAYREKNNKGLIEEGEITILYD